jgi:chitodextrinase
MRQLANYVASACNGDMTNLLLSGFPTQKPTRQPVGVLPPPSNVTLTQGDRSSEVVAKASPVFGASLYTWTLTSATPGAAVQTAQTTAARDTFTGLTPGATYSITVNAIGTAGASDWSNPASLMVV